MYTLDVADPTEKSGAAVHISCELHTASIMSEPFIVVSAVFGVFVLVTLLFMCCHCAEEILRSVHEHQARIAQVELKSDVVTIQASENSTHEMPTGSVIVIIMPGMQFPSCVGNRV